MPIFVIHGPRASGKTRNGEAFRKKLNAKRVFEFDEPCYQGEICDGDLVLTCHLDRVRKALEGREIREYTIAAAKRWL